MPFACGQITPNEGATVASLVLNYARAQDVRKLEARLDRLEMEANSLRGS